jgi:hypothetical protein
MNSIHNLLNEVNLKTKPIKSTGSKYSIPNEVFEKLKLNTQFKLYYPEDDFNVPCCCAFFLINNKWDKKDLEVLKRQTGADLLIGMQTSDRFTETDNVIDGTICCELEQVDRIIHQFQAMLSVHGGYVAMDLNDIISFFNQCQYTQYTESKLYLSDDLTKQNKQEVDEFIDKLPIRNVKNLLLYTHSIESTSLEQFSEIVETVERKVDDSDMFLHGMALTNTLNYAYISVMYPIEPAQS